MSTNINTHKILPGKCMMAIKAMLANDKKGRPISPATCKVINHTDYLYWVTRADAAKHQVIISTLKERLSNKLVGILPQKYMTTFNVTNLKTGKPEVYKVDMSYTEAVMIATPVSFPNDPKYCLAELICLRIPMGSEARAKLTYDMNPDAYIGYLGCDIFQEVITDTSKRMADIKTFHYNKLTKVSDGQYNLSTYTFTGKPDEFLIDECRPVKNSNGKYTAPKRWAFCVDATPVPVINEGIHESTNSCVMAASAVRDHLRNKIWTPDYCNKLNLAVQNHTAQQISKKPAKIKPVHYTTGGDESEANMPMADQIAALFGWNKKKSNASTKK